MTTLRDEIVTALKQDQCYPTHHLQHSNVKDLIGELLEVLGGMPGDTKELYTKIGRWLEREFLVRPMYGVLHHFQGLFTGLVQSGAEEGGIGALIDALAAVTRDSADLPDIRGGDVVVRTTLRQSTLYKSSVEHRICKVVKNANGGKREG